MSTRRPRRRDENARGAPGQDRRMTRAERDEAKQLWAGGRTVAQIAKTLGRTIPEVTFVMQDQPPAEVREVDDTPGRLR